MKKLERGAWPLFAFICSQHHMTFMKLLIGSFLTLLVTFAFSQRTFDDLSNGACDCIEQIDLSKPVNKRQQKATKCIEQAYVEYEDVLALEGEAYLSEYPDATDLQFGQYIQGKITSSLIDQCDPFFDIIMEIAIANPQFNTIPVTRYMKTIAEKMCNCISKIDDLTQDKADECMITYFDVKSEDFKSALAKDPEFVENTTAYLVKTCRPYAKLAVKQGRL